MCHFYMAEWKRTRISSISYSGVIASTFCSFSLNIILRFRINVYFPREGKRTERYEETRPIMIHCIIVTCSFVSHNSLRRKHQTFHKEFDKMIITYLSCTFFIINRSNYDILAVQIEFLSPYLAYVQSGFIFTFENE